MKKAILIASFIIFTGITGLFAQHVQINPIPCVNYQLTAENTAFQEIITHVNPSREKRDMDVTISSSSTHPSLVFAKVWVVKENGSVVKGPYYIHLNQVLSVPIDHSQWGVIINCGWSVNASVWIQD